MSSLYTYMVFGWTKIKEGRGGFLQTFLVYFNLLEGRGRKWRDPPVVMGSVNL